MQLSEFALLVGAPPKWVLNAFAALDGSLDYSLPVARRLTIARALQDGLGVVLPRAWALAGEALRQYDETRSPVMLGRAEDGTVEVAVDVYRLLASFTVRLSRLRTMHAPKRPGRRPVLDQDPLHAAEAFGVDLSLLAANLRRTPAQRLRQLDAMVDFRRKVRRKSKT